MRRNLVIFTLLASAFVVCKMDPAPPSEADAKQVWLNVNKQAGLTSKIELVDLKKTDGQMAEANGVKVYYAFLRSAQAIFDFNGPLETWRYRDNQVELWLSKN